MATTYLHKLRLISRDARLFLTAVALSELARMGIYNLLFNLYLLRLGYGPEFIGLVNGVGALAFSVLCLPAGVLGTRWSNRGMIITGMCLMAFGYALPPMAEFIPTAWQAAWLFSTRVAGGSGFALTAVNGVPFLMGATQAEERTHAFSVQMALTPLAGFAGSLVGGALPRVFGALLGVSSEHPAPYRYPLLLAALLLIPAVLALVAAREVPAKRAEERVAMGGRAPYLLIALMGLVVMLWWAGHATANTFFNVYLDAGLHVSTALIGALSAIGRLLSVPAVLITPLLVARWGNHRTMVLGSLGAALSILPLALIPHWSAAGLGVAGVVALFSIMGTPINIYSQEIVSPGWRAAISGAVMMGGGLSASSVALAGGYAIAAFGYRSLFLAGAGSTVAGALLFWAYFRVPRGELARRFGPDSGDGKALRRHLQCREGGQSTCEVEPGG